MSEESATVNTIMEFERETSRLFQAGDVDRMKEYMADDVKLLNPGSELLVGSEHERTALFEASQMKGMDMSFEPTGGEISASDNGGPGYRESYWAGYYAAFVLDPDGHNIEAAYWDYEKAGEKRPE